MARLYGRKRSAVAVGREVQGSRLDPLHPCGPKVVGCAGIGGALHIQGMNVHADYGVWTVSMEGVLARKYVLRLRTLIIARLPTAWTYRYVLGFPGVARAH